MRDTKDHFVKLFKHVAWADARVLKCLRESRKVLKKDLELYGHILGSEHNWLARIRGVTARFAVWPNLTLDECERLSNENVAGYQQLLESATIESLQRPITYRNSAGDEFTSTLEDILTHVSLHGSYHRGQIAASVRANGENPIPTDYIAFARGSPAATRRL